MKQSHKKLITAFRTILRKITRHSDHTRWENQDSLHFSWDERTSLIAQMIPSNSSIIEFGAGQMALKKHLEPNADYTASDFVQREGSHLIYDLNASQLEAFEKNYDIAIFSGVLEYVNDIPRLIAHLSENSFKYVIASYAINEKNGGLIFRRNSGWVNDYSSIEIKNIFKTQNFKCVKTKIWKNQEIYLFTNDNFKDVQ